MHFVGNLDVTVFFLIGFLSLGVAAIRFISVPSNPHRSFGYGIGGFSLAFLFWAGIIATHPEPLDTFMSLAVAPFVLGFFFLLRAATYDWLPRNRMIIYTVGAVYLAALFAVRTWVFPSQPNFSKLGLIYFNAHPAVLELYLLAFVGAYMTALHVVTRQIPNRLQAALTRILFNLLALSGVVLLVTYNETMQYLNGTLLILAFLATLVLYLPKDSAKKLV